MSTNVLALGAKISGGNSTDAAGDVDTEFTGAAEECIGYSSIHVSVFMDQNSTLEIQQSSDSTNWFSTKTLEGTTNVAYVISDGITARYCRVVCTADATPLVARVQTRLIAAQQSLQTLETNTASLTVTGNGTADGAVRVTLASDTTGQIDVSLAGNAGKYGFLGTTGTTTLGTAGVLSQIVASNENPTLTRYLRVYDQNTPATESDDGSTLVSLIPLYPQTSKTYDLNLTMSSGISVRATTEITNGSTGAPGATEIPATILFRAA